MGRLITLDEFIIKRQKDFPYASGELTALLRDIGLAAKMINREVNRAGLVNIIGLADQQNSSGDTVQKLDIYANDRMIEFLANSGECCGIASEELEDFIPLPDVESKNAKYVVVFDPLDGSSNIDVNVSVGTIFGIYRRISDVNSPVTKEDFLQPGNKLVAAGYVTYGTSTILVYTTGNGVNGFTLDPSVGEFFLSHRDIKIPEKAKYYSVNQGYYLKYDFGMRRYIDHCNELNLKLRYIGTMVSDIHRILFQGGVFIYPNMSDYPMGKLRLLYECNPMAMIVEQCGGKATTCQGLRILDKEVSDLHQRTSIAIGSPRMVEDVKDFSEKYKAMMVAAH